jgi:hypothetical protein
LVPINKNSILKYLQMYKADVNIRDELLIGKACHLLHNKRIMKNILNLAYKYIPPP